MIEIKLVRNQAFQEGDDALLVSLVLKEQWGVLLDSPANYQDGLPKTVIPTKGALEIILGNIRLEIINYITTQLESASSRFLEQYTGDPHQ